MTHNDDAKIFFCSQCNYTSKRKFNLTRHLNVIHNCVSVDFNENTKSQENVIPNEENVIPNEKNVIPNEKNVIPNR